MLKVLVAFRGGLQNPVKELLSNYRLDCFPPDEDTLPERISKNGYDVILLQAGKELLRAAKAADPRPEIIVFAPAAGGADGAHEGVPELVKQGALALFPAPEELSPSHLEALRLALAGSVEHFTMRKETHHLEKELGGKYDFMGMHGKNPRMLDIFAFLRRIAPYYKSVTITGETGTGKEVLARALHALSPASGEPFVVCNCASLVEGLIESELFGHRKGSFTGALSDKGGLFEAAGQGTMFLDEIGEMPLSFQPHFLRVLQDGEFRSVGGNTVSRAHCRIITATNRDLYLEVKEGRFRDDLYYRVSAITINVPPLRDRKEDISFLSRVMIERFSARTGKTINGLSRPAMQALLSHQWPGNVRELENVLEQAAILTTETFIKLEDLPPHIREKSDDVTEKIMTLEEVTRKHIEEVLKKNNGNRSHAAKFLGISRRALIRKIEKYSL